MHRGLSRPPHSPPAIRRNLARLFVQRDQTNPPDQTDDRTSRRATRFAGRLARTTKHRPAGRPGTVKPTPRTWPELAAVPEKGTSRVPAGVFAPATSRKPAEIHRRPPWLAGGNRAPALSCRQRRVCWNSPGVGEKRRRSCAAFRRRQTGGVPCRHVGLEIPRPPLRPRRLEARASGSISGRTHFGLASPVSRSNISTAWERKFGGPGRKPLAVTIPRLPTDHPKIRSRINR